MDMDDESMTTYAVIFVFALVRPVRERIRCYLNGGHGEHKSTSYLPQQCNHDLAPRNYVSVMRGFESSRSRFKLFCEEANQLDLDAASFPGSTFNTWVVASYHDSGGFALTPGANTI
jgi:hypothetical protein